MTRRDLFGAVVAAVGVLFSPRTAASAPESVIVAPVLVTTTEGPPDYRYVLLKYATNEACRRMDEAKMREIFPHGVYPGKMRRVTEQGWHYVNE